MKKLDATATAFRFLLGGIGAGNISLDNNGRLCDFELFNHPDKELRAAHSFFAVRVQAEGGSPEVRLLESQLMPPFTQPQGFCAWENGGLPRFTHGSITCEYPFVQYDFTDPTLPITASLEAFTPFIPLNTDDSSLPVALLRYRVRNHSAQPLAVSVAGSMMNFCGFTGFNVFQNHQFHGGQRNEFCDLDGGQGIRFLPEGTTPADLDYLETALFTTAHNGVTRRRYWNEGFWWDGLQDFWNEFTDTGRVSEHPLPGRGSDLHKSHLNIGSVCIERSVEAGGEAVFEFVISWYRPNRLRAWSQDAPRDTTPLIRNYSAKFGDAAATAGYLIKNLLRLEGDSRMFHRALYSEGMPDYVSDAIASAATVLRSQTCFRVEDGTFFGWEGCFDKQGSCEGNCTHVWNYTQLMAFLFPELEHSMRTTEFLTETDDDGRQYFRATRYLEGYPSDYALPAADGQLGTIVRLYRDWQLCGDDAFLRTLWPKARLALEYAFKAWDIDGDGLMESSQHNTYDIEFYGITTMTNTILLAALRAGEKMARYLGEHDTADRYAVIFHKGSENLENLTWNGEYYTQHLDEIEQYKYQYGIGCLADQLLGQQIAHVSGLGYLLEPSHVKSAVHSVFTYNMRYGFDTHVNSQRAFALGDDAGLINCSWPHSGRPPIPFVYSDEVWSGIEYQVAAHLIYEGFVREGLEIVKQVRLRHDGIKRNPWNEVECGHHYARSMSSYAVLLALTGFHCDAVNKTLHFKSAWTKDFSAFFCCADGWGVFKQLNGVVTVETLYGNLDAYTVSI